MKGKINDLVSVIMPYYQKEKFLKNSVKSVLQQTHKNLELILVDDELSKKSSKLLKELLIKDKRIKLIVNKKQSGAGISRNNAIKIASGKFIAFCDCDDLWVKNKIEKQLKFMRKNNLKFSFTSYKIINIKNKVIGHRKASNILMYRDLLKSCDIGLSTVILKKNLLNKKKNFLFPNIKTKEDYVLWLKLAKKGIGLFGLNQDLTKWRKLNNSLSSSTLQKIKDGFKVYRYYQKFGVTKSIFFLVILSFNSVLKY
jgi:teichuronic acid biosynthesis glycosyltransferase TuaG